MRESDLTTPECALGLKESIRAYSAHTVSIFGAYLWGMIAPGQLAALVWNVARLAKHGGCEHVSILIKTMAYDPVAPEYEAIIVREFFPEVQL